jgi:hypothetical protein
VGPNVPKLFTSSVIANTKISFDEYQFNTTKLAHLEPIRNQDISGKVDKVSERLINASEITKLGLQSGTNG